MMNASLLNIWNQHDERIARKHRDDFGQRGWLLSWLLTEDGQWQARLSTPELPYTVERTGRSRFQAIDRAFRALNSLLALRGDAQFLANRLTFEPIPADETGPEQARS